MGLVRMEAENGAAIYLNPEHVESVIGSADARFTVVSTTHRAHVVEGTPEEVHAKLFAPPGATDWKSIAHELASRMFTVGEMDECFAPLVARHTHKALGLEGK